MGIDNLYLEISFIVDDKKETYNYKLRVEEVFKNENLIYLKGKKIGEEDVVSSEFLIDEDKFSKVIDIFNEVNSDNVDKLDSELNDLFNNLGKGFFYNETVYKVK